MFLLFSGYIFISNFNILKNSVFCYLHRYVTATGDQKASSGFPGGVEVVYSRHGVTATSRDGVTASFSKDTSEVKPGQKKSGPLLMFLNKGKSIYHFSSLLYS